jgi:hypothetical protein
MEPIGPRITGVEHKVGQLKDAVERMASNRDGSQSVSHVTISAGGLGVWLTTLAAVVMMVVNVGLGFLYLDLRRSVDRVEDYQNTTFSVVPKLREEVEKIIQQRKEREQ